MELLVTLTLEEENVLFLREGDEYREYVAEVADRRNGSNSSFHVEGR